MCSEWPILKILFYSYPLKKKQLPHTLQLAGTGHRVPYLKESFLLVQFRQPQAQLLEHYVLSFLMCGRATYQSMTVHVLRFVSTLTFCIQDVWPPPWKQILSIRLNVSTMIDVVAIERKKDRTSIGKTALSDVSKITSSRKARHRLAHPAHDLYGTMRKVLQKVVTMFQIFGILMPIHLQHVDEDGTVLFRVVSF